MFRLGIKFLTVFFAASYIMLNLSAICGKFIPVGIDPFEFISILWFIPTSIMVTYIGVQFISLKKAIGISFSFLVIMYIMQIIISIYLVPALINYVEPVTTWEYYKDQILGAIEKMKPLPWVIGGIFGLLASRVILKFGCCKASR